MNTMRWMLWLLLAGCKSGQESGETDLPDTDVDSDVPPASPVVVYFTVDTLGAVAADEFGYCEKLSALTAEYGVELACLEGAVAPSSWTLMSHARDLFPENAGDPYRARATPRCAAVGVMGTIKEHTGAFYTFGADNHILGTAANDATICQDEHGELSSFELGSDTHYDELHDLIDLPTLPEAERPASLATADLVDAIADGRPALAFLNAFEPGGHMPRCYANPDAPSCDALWDLAVEAGVVDADADRASTWPTHSFTEDLLAHVTSLRDEEFTTLRPLMWGTIQESIADHYQWSVEDRLRAILDALQTADRLDDLVLVITADHGENPCVSMPFLDRMNCEHSNLPTEYTAAVPALVAPASLAETWAQQGFIGDAARPWSTANFAYALVDHVGADVPAEWPAYEAPGVVTSWTCSQNGIAEGIHIEGDRSVRCQNDDCGAWMWRVPTDELLDPEPIDPVPTDLADWAASPNPFQGWCE